MRGEHELGLRGERVGELEVDRGAAGREGQLAAAYTFQPGAAARALELLGKHVGLFTDRLEVSARNDEPLTDLREDEMFELLSCHKSTPKLVAAGDETSGVSGLAGSHGRRHRCLRGVLYLGRDILIPVALEILLSFMLAPIVIRLRRWGLGRIPSVLAVVLLLSVALLGLGSIVASQVVHLADNLPRYEWNLRTKIRDLRIAVPSGGVVERTSDMLRDLRQELQEVTKTPAESEAKSGEQAEAPEPVLVQIQQPDASPLQTLREVGGPLVAPIATAGLVVVFVIFMLLQGALLLMGRCGGVGRAGVAWVSSLATLLAAGDHLLLVRGRGQRGVGARAGLRLGHRLVEALNLLVAVGKRRPGDREHDGAGDEHVTGHVCLLLQRPADAILAGRSGVRRDWSGNVLSLPLCQRAETAHVQLPGRDPLP